MKDEVTDLRKSRDISIKHSVKKELNYLEALHRNGTLKKAILEHKKILKNKNNKTARLQRKIRTLYNENTSYRLKLEGQGTNIVRKNSKDLYDKILLTTRDIREKITTPPSGNQELLDKILISTKLMRRKMTMPPKTYKIDDCKSMDSILISTLCMRKETMMINCQNNNKIMEHKNTKG